MREGERVKNSKVYVEVTAVFTPDGMLKPVCITWEDGRRYEITRVRDCVRAASRKAGGTGLRFTCIVNGIQCYLYYEENYRWFVEARDV